MRRPSASGCIRAAEAVGLLSASAGRGRRPMPRPSPPDTPARSRRRCAASPLSLGPMALPTATMTKKCAFCSMPPITTFAIALKPMARRWLTLAEVRLGMARRVVQRHEHLAAAPLMLTHVGLHDGVAAGEPVLIAQTVEDPLRRVTLLARAIGVLAQPRIDDLGEPVELRPLHRRGPPVAGRHRMHDHLVDAVARDAEVARDGALAHALPEVGAANLPIQLHGENAPALPAARDGKRGRLLRRPPRAHPAATVAAFSPPFSARGGRDYLLGISASTGPARVLETL